MEFTDEAFVSFVSCGLTPDVAPHIAAQRLTYLRLLVSPEGDQQGIIDWYWDRMSLGKPLPADELQVPTGEEVSKEDFAYTFETVNFSPGEVPEPHILILAWGTGDDAWEFHLTDTDPYPSTPHGHRPRRHREAWAKLDVYTGWIYNGSNRTTTRENKKVIKALWLNPEFRSFARRALEYKLAADPTFASRLKDERGVNHPLRLPR